MKIMPAIVVLFFTCESFQSKAQQADQIIQKGNDFYKEKKYPEAEKEYNKIIENDSNYAIAKFNLANTLYRMGKKDEATTIFNKLIANEKEISLSPDLY